MSNIGGKGPPTYIPVASRPSFSTVSFHRVGKIFEPEVGPLSSGDSFLTDSV